MSYRLLLKPTGVCAWPGLQGWARENQRDMEGMLPKRCDHCLASLFLAPFHVARPHGSLTTIYISIYLYNGFRVSHCNRAVPGSARSLGDAPGILNFSLLSFTYVRVPGQQLPKSKQRRGPYSVSETSWHRFLCL